MATKLMPGEESLAMTRQHYLAVAPALFVIALIAVALIVVLFLIPSKLGGLDISGARTVIAIIIAAFALVVGLIRWLRWRYKRYTLTNRRVIVENGVLSRNVESIALDRIQNTIIHRPLSDRLIGAGNIEIESAGRDGTEMLHLVPHAETFYNRLMAAIDEWRQGPPPGVQGVSQARQSGM